MNEYSEFLSPTQQNICYGCLKLSEDVRTMTGDEINLYKTFVEISLVNNLMCICSLCSHLLKKTKKFIDQCLKAKSILMQYIDKDIKPSSISLLTPMYNLSISHLNQGEPVGIENNIENTGFLDDEVFDEEDIPLTFLKSERSEGKRERRKKRKRDKCSKEKETNLVLKLENQDFDSKDEPDLDSKDEPDLDSKDEQDLDSKDEIKLTNFLEELDKNCLKRRKMGKSAQKKELREGFTPKMVQETDEYTVIKLSKEQVLKEMEDKSKCEEYLRCLYKCSHCVKGYNFEDVLNSHMEKHVKKKNWLECDICHQYCPNVVSFRGHMKSHTTRYKCKVCGCVRLARQVLLEHHSTCHTSEAVKYTCQKCDFVTIKRTSMQRHTRTRHIKTEKHPCEQCGKMLHSLEALRAHMARHDKSKRMQCEECGRGFVYRALLDQHKMAVHVRGDYYCVECDVKFKSRGNLKLHFKRHRRHRDVSTFKYECGQCDKRFIFPSSLTGHMTSAHGSMTRHECACGRAYATRDALRAHQRRAHKGEEAQHKINSAQESSENCINHDMQKKTDPTLLQ